MNPTYFIAPTDERRYLFMSKNVATELHYTENELKAIEALKAADGEPKTYKELGVSTAVLTSLMKKMEKFPDDPNLVRVYKEDFEDECPVCHNITKGKKYSIVK